MKIAATLAALSAVTLLWAAPAQQSLTPVPEPLAPVPSADDFDGAAWAEALRNPDLVERKRAYENVLDEAGRRDDVHEVVKAWAADTSNTELAWTAQLMLRELDQSPFRGLRALRSPRWNVTPFQGLGNDDLFKELEQLFDLDLSTPFRSSPRMKALVPDWPGTSRSEGLSIQSGPDGVKVEVRETVDGQEETKTYEAESLDALLQAHPELEERIGGRVDFRIDGAPGRSGLDDFFRNPFGGAPRRGAEDPFLRPDPDGGGGQRGLRPIEPRTDLLGVRMLPPDARRSPVEGVREGIGLEVVEVVPGTLADFLGIEPGDIVVALNGVEIASAEDVKRVLAERAKDEPVEVDLVDVDEKNWTRTWKP